MKPIRLAQVARWCGGRLHGDDAEVDAVSTDTRTLAADGRRVLFVALRGENFDGHAHVASARSRIACRSHLAGLPETKRQ